MTEFKICIFSWIIIDLGYGNKSSNYIERISVIFYFHLFKNIMNAKVQHQG